MLSLDDPRWRELEGGYRIPYDASISLKRVEQGGSSEWKELWNELHHQGDVGLASYAAIPNLVHIFEQQGRSDWNLYALAATIEIERHRKKNPRLPDWLDSSYRTAWAKLAIMALRDLAATPDELTLHTALCVVALAKGNLHLGALLNYLDMDEIKEQLEQHLAWSKLYDE